MKAAMQSCVALLCLPSIASAIRFVEMEEVDSYKERALFALPVGKCSCDIRELECLPDRDCVHDMVEKDEHNIALGVEVRKQLKTLATFRGGPITFIPVGKSLQWNGIHNWQAWVEQNILPSGFGADPGVPSNLPHDAYCHGETYTGKGTCLWKEFSSDESPSMGSSELFKLSKKPVSQEEVDQQIANFQKVQKRQGSPRDILMSLAHIHRIQFNLQPGITNTISKRVAQINPGKGVLRVALHVRRADACGREGADKHHIMDDDRFADEASKIDSPAQVSGKRNCYKTKVYINKLNEISKKYELPLAVYLASDDAGFLEQVRQGDPELYDKSSWYFANYSTEELTYNGMIEGGHGEKDVILTESALVDLWVVSHGQIFMGSMGSRFGKVGYLLATARHNRVVPFFSFDGHSQCCEIDEICSKATEAMDSMENCLTFSHELVSKPINKDYWQVGSTLRYIK